MNDGLRFRAVRPAEIPLAAQQSLEAFGGSLSEQEETEGRLRAALEAGELWGMDAGAGLIAHCRLHAVDHFFGGRPVRSMDVGGVAVAPSYRRRGVATALMEGAAAWGAHQGLALSLLYPGVVPLYRRLGWEMAGTFPRYSLSASLEAPRAEAMRPATAVDEAAIVACNQTFAAALNGPGLRRPGRWLHLLNGKAQYVLDGADGIEAYVLLHRGAEPNEPSDAPLTIDWAATTGRGMRAVTALLASDAVPAGSTVRAPLPDAWGAWLGSWELPAGGGLLWMARPLDLRTAVGARGYPAALTGSVTLAVDDRLLAEVRGPWRLEVAGGRGSLEPSGSADVLLDTRAVGPLFTGFRSPAQLALAGLLDGPPASLDVLAAMFAGTPPVALDFF